MKLNEKVIVNIIKEEYTKRLVEALGTIHNVEGEKLNILEPELKLKLRKDDKKRNLPAGMLYTIDSVGADGVVLRRDRVDSNEPTVDSYEPSSRIVSYKELERDFELD